MADSDPTSPEFFDALSENYEDTVTHGTKLVDGDDHYLTRYKIELTKEIKAEAFQILDFGAGVGLSQKYIQKLFPTSIYSATDTSEKSLAKLKSNFPNVITKSPEQLFREDKNYYDLIYVSCVFHHIKPIKRKEILTSLYECLADGGSLIIFEHNPYNPLTQIVVKTSPIDKGVVLLTKSELCSLGGELNDLSYSWGYTVFFPSFLRELRKYERKYLRKFWLGAQYYVHFKKTKDKKNFSSQCD